MRGPWLALAMVPLPIWSFAACPAAPVAHPSDTVINMLLSDGTAALGPTDRVPSTGEGAVVYDDTNNLLKVCDGTTWQSVGSGGAGADNLGDHTATQSLTMGGFNITGTGATSTSYHYGQYASLTTIYNPGSLSGNAIYANVTSSTLVSATNISATTGHFAGNVGIGTTSPARLLDLSADAPTLRLTDTDTALSDLEQATAIEFYQSDTSGAGVGSSIRTYGDGSTGLLSLAFTAGANTEHLRIDGSSGNVGIGSSSPNVRLDVSGTIVSRVLNAGSGTSIDFSQSNVAYTSTACGSFTLSNMQDGGSYSLIVKGSDTGPATFTHSGLTVKTTTTLTCISGKHSVFSFLRAGTDLYVTMITGY